MVTLYPHLAKKTKFWPFLEGDSGWLSYSQNTFVVSFWSFFLHLFEQRKKLNPLVCKRSFGGRSLPIQQKTPIYSFFCASPSGRHRTRSDKVSPSNWSSGLSILWHSKNLTRLLRERPFWGHFILTPRWKKNEFWSFSQGDSGWLSYSQNTLEESFWSVFLRLIEQWKILTRSCEKGHLVADLNPLTTGI